MMATIDQHSRLIMSGLAIVVLVFAVSCATQSPLCQWLFGCG